MEPHVNLLLLNICPPATLHEIVKELLQSPGNEQKVHVFGGKMSHVQRKSEVAKD